MSRIRTRSLAGPSGIFISTSGSFIGQSASSSTAQISKCTDEPGAWDNAFDVSHAFVVNGALTYFNPQGTKKLKSFVPSYWRTPLPLAPMTDPGRASNAELAVKLLAVTNPSRAKVELPVSLLELRELPLLVQAAGKKLIREIGDRNLRYYFGVVPLLSDIAALLNFAESIDNRVKLLKKFVDQGSMLRKATLYSGGVEDFPMSNVTANSSPPTSNVTYVLRSRRTVRTVWGYVSWTAHPTLLKTLVTERDIIHAARTIILGARIDFASAWEALPWSWLADYFGNIGDWLQANRHVLPIYPGIPRICETVRVENQYLSANNGFNMPPNYHSVTHVTVHKSRRLVSASLPSASMPLLTPRHALILSSVAASRRL